MKRLLAKEEINTGRQSEFDVAKGLAIVFMVLCHAYEYLSSCSNAAMTTVLDVILGGPFAAPVFMFCMGVGICFSRRNSPEDLLERGVKLMGISVLFGFVRDVLIVLATFMISREREVLTYLELFFCADILRFAALAFMFFALLKKVRASDAAVALIAAAFSCVGLLLQGVSSGSQPLDAVLGFFWMSYDLALFPFLNWFIFPAFGYVFARFWRRMKDVSFFYRRIVPVCAAVSALHVYSIVAYGLCFLSGRNYYGMGPLDAMLCMFDVMTVFGVSHVMLRCFRPLCGVLSRLSRHTTPIYCMHWIMIFSVSLPMKYIFHVWALPDGMIVPAGLLMLAACEALMWLASPERRKRRSGEGFRWHILLEIQYRFAMNSWARESYPVTTMHLQ